MEFKDEILKYENEQYENLYLLKIGNIPIMLTAVHTINQQEEDGTFKLKEPFTKAICMYISNKVDTSYFVKNNDDGINSNLLELDNYKKELLNLIKQNKIKLILDIHGAKEDRDFDIEFGTLNNLSADYSTIKELEDSFYENRIRVIKHNDPFKGGGITQYVYSETDIDVIQIEINKKYRNIENINNLKSVCDAIINFIKKYSDFD